MHGPHLTLGDDYIPGPLTGSITVANEPVCVNLPLNTDSIVEGTETVLLTVSSADSPTTDTTTLNILDDDGGWEMLFYSIFCFLSHKSYHGS